MLRCVTALVTGGASGLGRSAASHVLRNGGNVIVADLASQRELAMTLLEAHSGAEGRFAFSACDVTSENDVNAALDACKTLIGGPSNPNVVVNCAGIATPGRVVGKKGALPLDRFRSVLEVNTVGE